MQYKHLKVHFFFTCPFRLVKLRLGLAAHPPTLWTPGKVQFVLPLKQQTLKQTCVLGAGEKLYVNMAYFSVKTGFSAIANLISCKIIYIWSTFSLMYGNIFDREWRELILFTLAYYIKNTPLIKSQYILTLKSHHSTNMYDDTLCSPLLSYPGVAVLFLTLWWSSIKV